MGLAMLKSVCDFLGPMYTVKKIDMVETIYRKVNERFEFEVTGFFGTSKMTVNLWQIRPHRDLMAIYSGIRTKEELSDTLGYLSFKYQSLSERIRVEREDPLL